MTEELHAQIKHLIQINGPMGVNALSKSISDVPLSSLQRYLDSKQTYFKKTNDRKWDLPENVASSEMSSADDNYATIIRSQIEGLTATVDLLNGQLKSTLTLMSVHTPKNPSVATKSRQINQVFLRVEEHANMMVKVVKSKLSDIPEEYQQLLLNVDWLVFMLSKGTIYVDDIVTPEISNVILKETDKLPDDILIVLKEYQKPNNSTNKDITSAE